MRIGEEDVGRGLESREDSFDDVRYEVESTVNRFTSMEDRKR